MIKVLNRQNILLTFIVLFAFLQFFLLIRHKDPFISDSYFYEHVYYTHQGMDFNQAYNQVRSEIDFSKNDEITKQIFSNEDKYINSLTFFDKRPLYPFLAYLTSLIYKNNYLNMLLPVIISFIGTVLLVFLIVKKEKGLFFATLVTIFLLAFYPFLDWSTYFLTDTIGSFLWIFQLYLFYLYLKNNKRLYLISGFTIYILALINREQAILMVPLFGLFGLLGMRFKYPKDKLKKIGLGLLGIIIISLIFVIISSVLGQKNLLDTFAYNQSNYGLNSTTVNSSTPLNFWMSSLIDFHIKLVNDLVTRHFTVVFLILGVLIVTYKLFTNRLSLLDQLILSSTIASYLFVFFFPIFSYRYYYLTIIGVIYFFVMFLFDFFSLKSNKLD